MTRFLRYVRVSFFLLAAVLTGACGGNTAVSSGSGGDSPVGGAGGTTGSTSSGGGGAGGTGGGSGCSPDCVSPEVCEEGTCKALTELQLVADDILFFAGDPAPLHRGQAQACARVHTPVPAEILGEEGGCVAYEAPDPGEWSYLPVEAGDLTVESPNVGLLPLTAAAPHDCLLYKLAGGMDLAPGEGFSAGETVTFASTGGAMFPEAQLEASFPDDFVLQENPVFVLGEPHEVQWSGATPLTVELVDTVNGRYIECTPAPGGTLTVPASVTQYIGSSWVKVVGISWSTTTIEVSPSRRITAFARRFGGYAAY